MDFNDYAKAVRKEQALGGLSDVGCLVVALRKTRPDLWQQINQVKGYDPTMDEKYAGTFVVWLMVNWDK